MAVSSTTGGLRTGVCLSTDRPDNPYDGQVVYETDTNRTLVWDNSAWVVINDPALMSYSGTGVTVTADAMTLGGDNVVPYTGRRNLLYNGAMQVAQRGTSATGISSGTNQYYTTDRYAITVQDSGGTWTNSVVSDAPHGFGKSLKMTCTTAQASLGTSDAASISQRLEGQDLQGIAKGTSSAKEVTLSFWVKSNVTGTYVITLIDYDDIYGRSVSKQYTISSTDTWEYKTITYPADTTGGAFDDDNQLSLEMKMWLAAGSGYTSGTLNETWDLFDSVNLAVGQVNLASSVNNYWQITGVQLEVGDKATPFEHRSYGEELALCQRYYTRFTRDVGFQPVGGTGIVRSSTDCSRVTVDLPTTMRANGNAANIEYNNMVIWDGTAVRVITSFALVQVFQNKVSLDCTSSGMVTGYPGVLLTNNASDSYFAVNLEL